MLKKLGLEGWFAAHFAYGIVQIVFIPMLMPSFILARTGSATQAGLAMAVFGMAGLAAPIIGGLADKYKAHRHAQLFGMICYLLAGASFVVAGESFPLMLVGAACFGVGSAILLMLNPVFITFAGYDTKTEAMKLGRMAQTLIIGALLSGVALAYITDLGWSYEQRFGVMMAIVVVLFVITMFTNKAAAQRVLANAEASAEADVDGKEDVGLVKSLFSNFGLFLLAVGLLCAGQGAFQAQYPNLLENAYGVAQSLSAANLSVASVVGLFILIAAERFVARYGNLSLFKVSAIASIIVIGLLYVIAEAGMSVHYIITLGLFLIYLQGITITDMISPAIAARLTVVGGGLTQGLMMFFISLGFAAGSVISGVAVDGFGWAALPFAILALTIAAYVCIVIVGVKHKASVKHKQQQAAA
ncbi:MFS transporter [Vibrio barjaei]|jgi:MFS family permease|uniref:MFS transporter n=1 Tax=Vibrio barjaei TaxID=1676683 RepID=A0ABW7IG73_9VIBR|nr:MFS transporter [Vibrio barjaei]MCG9787599.1 MFS transporter [Vibrio mediterranei]MCY9871627.1 MFS transporter [Vibrio barjaei]